MRSENFLKPVVNKKVDKHIYIYIFIYLYIYYICTYVTSSPDIQQSEYEALQFNCKCIYAPKTFKELMPTMTPSCLKPEIHFFQTSIFANVIFSGL